MENLVKIPDLQFGTTLKSHILYEMLCLKVLDELKKIPNIASFKLSNEFTVLVCTLIENAVKKKDKVDKKKLAMQILTTLFGLSVIEQTTLSNDIEKLLQNTDRIRKIVKPIIQRAYRKVYKTVFKKA